MLARRIALSAAAILIALCSGQSQAKPKIDTVVYEVRMSSPHGNMGTRKMYRRGEHFIWDADSAGLKVKFIKNKDGAFMIHPKERFAAKYPAGSNRESPMTFLPGPAGDVKEFLEANEAKKEGQETINKKVCDIYTYTEKETKWKCKLWVEQDKLTPVKMVMKGAKETDVIEVTYLSYKLGAVIASSRFELPKGIEIRPMPERLTREDTVGAERETKKDQSEAKLVESAENK